MHWTLFLCSLVRVFSRKDSFVYFDITAIMYALSPKPLYEVCLTHFIFSTPPTTLLIDQQYQYNVVVLVMIYIYFSVNVLFVVL